MAFTPVSLHTHVNKNSPKIYWERDRSSLDGAADASVSDVHPLFNRLAVLVDGQGLLNVQGWPAYQLTVQARSLVVAGLILTVAEF